MASNPSEPVFLAHFLGEGVQLQLVRDADIPVADPKFSSTNGALRDFLGGGTHGDAHWVQSAREDHDENLGPRVRKAMDQFPSYSGEMPPPEAARFRKKLGWRNFVGRNEMKH